MTTTTPVEIPVPRSGRALGSSRGLLVALLGTVAVFLEGLGWPLALAAHFSPHVMVGNVLLAVLALVRGRRRWTLVFLLAAALLGGRMVWSASHGDPPPEAATVAEISLGLVNVHTLNGDHPAVIEWARAETLDLLAVIEASQEWLDALAPLSSRLAHQVAHPREDNFGIALYSRWPILSGGIFRLGTEQIDVVVAAPEGPLRVLVTHPPPPDQAGTAAQNRRVTREVGRRARTSREPVIVAGDLNATPFSAGFRELVATGGLQRRRHGLLMPTWPDRAFLLPFGIAIDHVLVRGPLRVEEQSRGPAVGSDHRPLRLRIARVR